MRNSLISEMLKYNIESFHSNRIDSETFVKTCKAILEVNTKDNKCVDWKLLYCDPANPDSRLLYYRQYYSLGIMEYDDSGLICKNKGTIKVSKDVIDFLNFHNVSLDSKGNKVYKYNNIKYIDLGPVTEMWSKDEIR